MDENCFYNCVGESEKALLVSVSTKGITADHENWIEQHSTKDSYFSNDFIHSCLDTISLWMVRSEERRLYSPAKIH